jgi:predicted Fe-Mo cluster-binding NifX family protein
MARTESTTMRVALASQNRRTLTAHAGKCTHFFVFDLTQPELAPESVALSPIQSLANWAGESPHPLEGINSLIAASVGCGVAHKLARHGIHAFATSERDLEKVIAAFIDGSLPVEALRTEADARSRPGACLERKAPATLHNLIGSRRN